MTIPKMKTPISYYGGKQMMVNDILPLIPPHSLYTECFVGGAAIYFSKPPSISEVINDKNGEVVNFYRVVKTNYDALRVLINATLHSRAMYVEAMGIYHSPANHSEVRRAWSFWVGCNQSFLSSIGGGWAYQRKGNNKAAIKTMNKVDNFTEKFCERLRTTSVECDDAPKVVKRFDFEDAFHYLDPPYYNANMGHYGGYTLEMFDDLLSVLSQIKGKFLLSSYPSPILADYTERNGWFQKELLKNKSANHGKDKKIEVLTANYPIV